MLQKKYIKAFTVAEITIAMTLIGVIAMMTLPSLSGNINSNQFKTSYKKAYSNIFGIAKQEAAKGTLPEDNSPASVVKFFSALNENFDVKEYVSQSNAPCDDKGKIYDASDEYHKLSWAGQNFQVSEGAAGGTLNAGAYSDKNTYSPWIVTRDQLAYTVRGGDGKVKDCDSSSSYNLGYINSAELKKGAKFTIPSCVVVLVDVNGLRKGPNKKESQSQVALTPNIAADRVSGDRFSIPIWSDGVGVGSKKYMIEARIIEDVK